jgi:type IV secretory pathway TraG/TraD family ATPase VirD4
MAVTLFVLAVIVIPIKIFQAVFNISNSLFLVDAQKTIFFGTVVSFWYWFTGNELPRAEEVPDESKGARFALPKEVDALRTAEGMAFGHVGGTPFFLKNEKHVLIMASTRSGKGVSLIIPHLLRYPGSAFILDPKAKTPWPRAAKGEAQRQGALS